jgi:hypothetical protein
MLLAKWILAYGNFGQWRLPVPQRNQIDEIINAVSDIEAKLLLPSEHPDFHLFLRGIAYQQFWYQEPPQRAHFARQARIFRRLDADHHLATRFHELTGLTIPTFLELSFFVAATFLDGSRRSVTLDYFATLHAKHSATTIERFFRILSRDANELRSQLLGSATKPGRVAYEYRERTPLMRHPILRVGSTYWIYQLPILLRGMETMVYDILRADNPSVFMNHFGRIFEDYVRLGVEQLGCSFLNEAELKRRYGHGKVVDFVLTSAAGTVFIDAKGVEMNDGIMVTANAELLTRQAENSILKGLSQAQELVARMQLTEPPFVLIVTYKHLFLGSGDDFARYADPIRFASAVGQRAGLEMSKVFFVSVEEFDYLASALGQKNMHLATLLEELSAKERTQEGKRMMMMQHIHDRLRPYAMPPYLAEEFQLIEEAALAGLQASAAQQGVAADGAVLHR